MSYEASEQMYWLCMGAVAVFVLCIICMALFADDEVPTMDCSLGISANGWDTEAGWPE